MEAAGNSFSLWVREACGGTLKRKRGDISGCDSFCKTKFINAEILLTIDTTHCVFFWKLGHNSVN